ncbi:DNA-binding CsgD family transcriptional regulator [Mycobacterium sp. URHB0021]
MVAGIASRPAEEAAVAEFLDSAAGAPAALVIEGEPGIGKTTLWLSSLERARGRGFQVLSARVATAESVCAYASLADLLAGVLPAVWAALPDPQRIAVDRVVSREDAVTPATDQRAVAAAFLSVIDHLSDDAPVLVAIDDLQWLDPSSAYVIAYAARRLSGPVGFLAAVRTDSDSGDVASWLQLPRPEAVHRIELRPLTSRALHTVVSENLGRPVPRVTMTRIHEASGGNPFYAIELARALEEGAVELLPHTLADLVRARIGSLDPAIHDALLAAACLATPTVEVVGRAIAMDNDHLVEVLEAAERKGIIAIEGHRIRFTHPLLASGVYTEASSTQRRVMHGRLAEVIDESELRARHLALSAATGDQDALRALDAAAASADARGAPAAAAELLELAIALGGDTVERRIRLAAHCFDAGDPGRARALLERAIAGMKPGPPRAHARHTLAIVRFIDDGYPETVQLLMRALDEDDPDPALRTRMLVALSHALFNIGKPEAARDRAEEAVAQADRLGDRGLVSQALGVRAMLHFLRGDGIDEPGLARALELEDHESFTPTALKPSVECALILGWTGELDKSYEQMRAIQQRCIEKGEEGELIFIDFHVVVNRIWRGDFGEAKRVAAASMELAGQLGGEFPVMLSRIIRAWLAAFGESEDDARAAIADAIDASKRNGSTWLEEWSLTALGFLETSLGNHEAALNTLEPLLVRHASMPNSTEIFAASFVPDAVEALTALGRVDEAAYLADTMESNGRRLGRAWMLAVGARCHSMALAAGGDTDAALAAAHRAMAEHDRVPMPFERARTQLFLGQLTDRRQTEDPAAALRAALTTFERLGTPLWADRARAELTRTEAARRRPAGLSTAEQRVAELAATGMTNRDVAAALYISPKTVEATLARVYRKLGIKSRGELGRRIATDTAGPTPS